MHLVETQHRPWSLFDVRVVGARRLTPNLARLTLGADPASRAAGRSSVAHFADHGFDQRIKIVLPTRSGPVPAVDPRRWHAELRALPAGIRPAIRTYTVRQVRQAGSPDAEIDIDVVLHGTTGPASAWAGQAVGGSPSGATLLGPDARCHTDPGGRAFVAPADSDLLIAGDETALPAIAAICERFDPRATGTVLIEVPTEHDVVPLAAPPGIRTRFLPRGAAGHGRRLVDAALAWRPENSDNAGAANDFADLRAADRAWDETAWDVPDSGQRIRAWIAGEAQAVRTIRRHLVGACALRREQVAFMGYWRLGRSES